MAKNPDGQALVTALAVLIGGRIDGAYVTPETGLVVLSVYVGRKALLGFGIGPNTTAVGWLPRVPKARAPAVHPLAAAMHAHLVNHRVRDIHIDEQDTLWIIAGSEGLPGRL